MTRFLSICIALAVLGGCTATRSVDAWRDGWLLEQKGEQTLALRKYADATSRLGKYTGALLNQIRLLAAVPERRPDAQALLDKVVKTEPADARVAAFSAMWALWQGDVPLAKTRVAAGVLREDDQEDTVRAFHQAELAVLIADKQWQAAWERAKNAAPKTPQERLRMAVLAWNVGEWQRASEWLVDAQPCKEKALLEALLAARAEQWPQTTVALARLEGDAATPLVLALRAQAALHADPPNLAVALRDAGDAARRDPADPLVTEVWAEAQLVAKQPQLARDLLAGLTVRGAGWSAWYNLGLAQLHLGDLTAAAQAFTVAAQRCPTCQPAVRNRDVLAKLGLGQ
jgi:hypothetical protein